MAREPLSKLLCYLHIALGNRITIYDKIDLQLARKPL